MVDTNSDVMETDTMVDVIKVHMMWLWWKAFGVVVVDAGGGVDIICFRLDMYNFCCKSLTLS